VGYIWVRTDRWIEVTPLCSPSNETQGGGSMANDHASISGPKVAGKLLSFQIEIADQINSLLFESGLLAVVGRVRFQ
jgi:hypothetical protein